MRTGVEVLSPAAKERALARLLEYTRAAGNRFSRAELAFFGAELDALARRLHRVVIFRPLRTEGRYEIGYEGEPLRHVTSTNRGVWAVWWLLDDGGKSEALRACDLAAPDAAEPEQSARRMIRTTAAKEFARWGMPVLEAAAKACTVTGGGVIRCERPAHAPKVITR